MTLIVGIKCKDGVVVAADSAATMSDGVVNTLGQQAVTKVQPLGQGGVFAATGSVGMAQTLRDKLGKWCDANLTKLAGGLEAMAGLSEQVRQVVVPQLQASAASVPLVGRDAAGSTAICKNLVAVVVRKQAHLFQFDHAGAPEMATTELPFITLGSGQPIADPFIAFLRRVLWAGREPTVADGRLAAAWTVYHVCKTNPGGVGPPMQMATLRAGDDGKPLLEFSGDEEHLEAVTDAEKALREHVAGKTEQDGAVPPRPNLTAPVGVVASRAAGNDDARP